MIGSIYREKGGVMNKQKSTMGLLVTIACMFTVSVGLLHGRKNSNPILIDQPIELTAQDSIDIITPSLLSGNIPSAVSLLKELKSDSIVGALQELMAGKGFDLSDTHKAALIIGVLPYVHKPHQRILFDLLLTTMRSQPFFYIAQSYGFENAIPLLVSLSKQVKNFNTLMIDSYIQTIEDNDVDVAQKLYSLSIRPDKQNGGNLLVYAINKNRDISFVPLFIQKLSVDPNYSPDGKKTLIMYAVEKNNEPMVRALLEVGADPDKILNNTVGSARQIAFEKNYIALEELMSASH